MSTYAVQVARFGRVETLELPEEAIYTFPEGIPGFEQSTRFALLEDPQYLPFRWLQAVDDLEAGFLVIDPFQVRADYAFELNDQDAAGLALERPEDAEVLCILVVPERIEELTANLKAPIVLNRRRRLGRQVILVDDAYGLREPVLRPQPAAPVESAGGRPAPC